MAFEDCTIQEFINGKYKEDYSKFSKEHIDIIFNEYIDAGGLYDEDEFQKVTYIHFLQNRLNSIRISVQAQIKFINEFKQPFQPNIEMINEQFGYCLIWNNDEKDFLIQLENIISSEIRFEDMLEDERDSLQSIRGNRSKEEKPTLKQQFESFTRTLNSLGKLGWKIDKKNDYMNELAIMIKQQTESR